jgi:hypothetical protein
MLVRARAGDKVDLPEGMGHVADGSASGGCAVSQATTVAGDSKGIRALARSRPDATLAGASKPSDGTWSLRFGVLNERSPGRTEYKWPSAKGRATGRATAEKPLRGRALRLGNRSHS